jgi:hypothetical protein
MVKKGLTLVLAAVATFGLAGFSLADVPSEVFSTVACSCTTDAQTGVGSGRDEPHECTICPGGDIWTEDIHVNVIVRNHLNQPLAGSTVTVHAVNLDPAYDCMIWDDGLVPGGPTDPDEDPQTAISAGDGSANFMYDEGGIGPLDQFMWTFPNIDFQVDMVGPGPGSATVYCQNQQLEVVGYDLNCDCIVNLPDLAIFGTWGWVDQHLKCDFNHDETVSLVDFAQFAQSWGHDCDNQ